VLVLKRHKEEEIVIGDEVVTVMVVEIKGNAVKLGIKAPLGVPVHRREVFDAIKREGGDINTHKPKGELTDNRAELNRD
jgi:carbon storage regulator